MIVTVLKTVAGDALLEDELAEELTDELEDSA